MEENQEKINTKKEDGYLQAILSKYQKERYKSLHYSLSEPTCGNIKAKIISILRKGVNVNFENTLKGFLGEHTKTKREDLIDIVDKNINKFRAIQRLLQGDTVNGKNNPDLLHLAAFLVELEQKESSIIEIDNSISISNIESGQDTNISIKNESKGISIDKIKSGKNTRLDI